MSEIELSKRRVKWHSHASIGSSLLSHGRLYAIAWTTVLAVILVDFVWMRLAGFTVSAWPATHIVTNLVLLTAATLILYRVASLPRYSEVATRLRIHHGCMTGHAVVLMGLFTYAAIVLQNLCVSLDRPLIDHQLVALDLALGFRWTDLFAWQMRHHVSSMLLSAIYQSFDIQVVLTIFALGFAGRLDDLADFLSLFMMVVLVAIVISAPFPASNPLIHFGFRGPHDDSPWSQFFALREGTMTDFGLDKCQGLISMPSLHAAYAVLLVYAARHLRWLFPVSTVWNIAMIYSAIPFGAHYLVDIIAGLALAAASIAITRSLKCGIARQN